MKICPSCKKPPSDPRLIRCEQCHEVFVEAEEIPLRLSNDDVKRVAKHFVNLPAFWIPFLAALALLCFSVWKGVGHFAKKEAEKLFNQEMTNRIKLEFQEPRIKEIVAQVASSEATNIIKSEISPAISKFQIALGQVMNDIPTNLFSKMTFETISVD